MSGKNVKQELILHRWRSKFLPNHVSKDPKKAEVPNSLRKFEENKEPVFSI